MSRGRCPSPQTGTIPARTGSGSTTCITSTTSMRQGGDVEGRGTSGLLPVGSPRIRRASAPAGSPTRFRCGSSTGSSGRARGFLCPTLPCTASRSRRATYAGGSNTTSSGTISSPTPRRWCSPGCFSMVTNPKNGSTLVLAFSRENSPSRFWRTAGISSAARCTTRSCSRTFSISSR